MPAELSLKTHQPRGHLEWRNLQMILGSGRGRGVMTPTSRPAESVWIPDPWNHTHHKIVFLGHLCKCIEVLGCVATAHEQQAHSDGKCPSDQKLLKFWGQLNRGFTGMEDHLVYTEVSDINAGFQVFSVGTGGPQQGQATAGGSWGMTHLPLLCSLCPPLFWPVSIFETKLSPWLCVLWSSTVSRQKSPVVKKKGQCLLVVFFPSPSGFQMTLYLLLWRNVMGKHPNSLQERLSPWQVTWEVLLWLLPLI